jgi:predicted phosphodiesterase
MIVQYLSDLHLEFRANAEYINDNPIEPHGDILVMAGDITNLDTLYLCKGFLDKLSRDFWKVFWVAGNHEYYGSNLSNYTKTFRKEIRNNVYLVNNVVEQAHDVDFLFTTLWSNIQPKNYEVLPHMMNDFRCIRYKNKLLTPKLFSQMHKEAVEFLKGYSKPAGRKSVVVSHHLPTLQNYPAEYVGDVLNECFATNLDEYIERAGHDFWIFGHHHRNVEAFDIGSTRMLTNQLGYVSVGEHKDFVSSYFEI